MCALSQLFLLIYPLLLFRLPPTSVLISTHTLLVFVIVVNIWRLYDPPLSAALSS